MDRAVRLGDVGDCMTSYRNGWLIISITGQTRLFSGDGFRAGIFLSAAFNTNIQT